MLKNFYPTSEKRARSRAFDRIQSGLLAREAATRQTYASQFLGGYRQVLRAAIESSFLPNVQHGVVTLPRREERQSNIPLLPIAPASDGRLLYDEKIVAPTPQKQATILGEDMAQLMAGLQGTQTRLTDLMRPVTTAEGEVRTVLGETIAQRWRDEVGTVVGRSIVQLCVEWPGAFDPQCEPWVAGHEFAHAVDNENWDLLGNGQSLSTRQVDAALELHACAASFVFEPHLGVLSADAYQAMDVARDMWTSGEYAHDAAPLLRAQEVDQAEALGLIGCVL